METWIQKVHTKHIIVLGGILLVFFLVILPIEARYLTKMTGTSASLDTSLYYTPKRLYEIAALYGIEGRTAYIWSRLRFDIAFPIAYGLFLFCGIALLYQKTSYVRYIAWIPLLAMGFDLLENTIISFLFLMFPKEFLWLAFLAGIATFVKWLTLSIAFIIVVFGLVLKRYHHVKVMSKEA